MPDAIASDVNQPLAKLTWTVEEVDCVGSVHTHRYGITGLIADDAR